MENIEEIDCPECDQMINYMGEYKWPTNCPMCGRPTKELKSPEEYE
jgi:endogenous inhibitor of DNA gyrase (YacG/DUF329 family)